MNLLVVHNLRLKTYINIVSLIFIWALGKEIRGGCKNEQL